MQIGRRAIMEAWPFIIYVCKYTDRRYANLLRPPIFLFHPRELVVPCHRQISTKYLSKERHVIIRQTIRFLSRSLSVPFRLDHEM